MSNVGKVLQAASRVPGKLFTREELAQWTGLELNQVDNAMYSLVSDQSVPVERIRPGVFRYADNSRAVKPARRSTATGKLFEEIARTKNGTVVLEDEDGTVWLATKTK